MDIKKYLSRINFDGKINADYKLLQRLQQSHLLNIPFENLDIHFNKKIELDYKNFYEKIVIKKRGGFCYELNGLFFLLLKELSFNVKMISAKVFNSKQNTFGAEYDHMAIIVSLNDTEYLVDVGFGEFTFTPIPIILNKIHTDPRGNFIIEKYDDEFFIVSKLENDKKLWQYIFSKKERELNEFEDMCIYHQTSSESHFTQKQLISKPTPKGRITISGNSLKITENGKVVQEIALLDNIEFGEKLLYYFGINIKDL